MAEIFGLEVGEVPQGWQPVDVLCIVSCVAFAEDSGGTTARKLSIRASEGLTCWEVLGMLEGYAADVRQQFIDTLIPDDEC